MIHGHSSADTFLNYLGVGFRFNQMQLNTHTMQIHHMEQLFV